MRGWKEEEGSENTIEDSRLELGRPDLKLGRGVRTTRGCAGLSGWEERGTGQGFLAWVTAWLLLPSAEAESTGG